LKKFLLLLVFLFSTAAFAEDAALRRGMVLLKITPLQIDPSRPWVKNPGAAVYRPGLVIQGKKILALAGDVQMAALIEVRKYSSSQMRVARRVMADREADLALLECEEDFFSDLQPLPFGADPVPGNVLRGVRMDALLRFEASDVSLREVDVMYITGMTPLAVARGTSIEPFPSGGVLMRQGRVAGFVFSREADRNIEFLFASHLARFIERSRSAYAGFVSSGFDYEGILDPALKRYYGLARSGVLVGKVYPGTTAASGLKPGDVLTVVDGVSIDERGFFEDPSYGRQRLDLLFARSPRGLRNPGEKMKVRVLRDKKEQDIVLELRRTDGTAIRLPVREENPAYHVESGLVFIELSLSYLTTTFGSSHASQAPALSYLFERHRYRESPSEQKIVILSRVLPDDVNLGYEDAGGSVLVSANGTAVGSVAELKSLLEKAQGIARLELRDGRVLYVDASARQEINARIKKKYSLPD
jgi:hypothetical protein